MRILGPRNIWAATNVMAKIFVCPQEEGLEVEGRMGITMRMRKIRRERRREKEKEEEKEED